MARLVDRQHTGVGWRIDIEADDVARSLGAFRAKRSCQRHAQVFDLPVRRMTSTVPLPSGGQTHDLGAPDMLLQGISVLDQRGQT